MINCSAHILFPVNTAAGKGGSIVFSFNEYPLTDVNREHWFPKRYCKLLADLFLLPQ